MKVIVEQPRLHQVCYLDKVGPVDNRPSTNKLNQFVWKKMYFWPCEQNYDSTGTGLGGGGLWAWGHY